MNIYSFCYSPVFMGIEKMLQNEQTELAYRDTWRGEGRFVAKRLKNLEKSD